jgi:predicted outer membrane repeat protein
VTLTDSILTSNTASLSGGGICSTAGTVTVNGSTLSGNEATHGGRGVFNSGGTVELDDSTLTGNSASVGAAIQSDLDGGTATVSGCTLTDNIAGIESGSIENRNSDGSSLTVRNSTFSGNQPKAILGAYTDGGGNSGI